MVKTQIHPTFQKTLRKQFIAVWLICAFSFAGSLAMHKFGYPRVGWGLASVFAGLAIGGLLYWRYQLRHVTCLVCQGKTKTMKDVTETKWMAHCRHCQIEWDLQTGVGND